MVAGGSTRLPKAMAMGYAIAICSGKKMVQSTSSPVPPPPGMPDMATLENTATMVLFDAYPQLLLLLWKCLIFLHFIGGILEIWVCGVDNVKAVFPVVLFHFCILLFHSCRLLRYNIFMTNFYAS
jgi:hypothetical protein